MIDPGILGFALAAGLVAAVNPCGFAMLPAYLSLVVAGSGEAISQPQALSRALAATIMMAAGFVAVFGVFGLVIAPLAAWLQAYLPFLTVLIGIALLVFGGLLLTGREITIMVPSPVTGAPTRRLRTMFGYGLAYAVASLSCTIGPFLAVTGATFRAGSVIGGVMAYVAYGVGMALIVGVLAVAVALAGVSVASAVRRILPIINRLSGVLVILVGLYVGYYGSYELRLFLGDGNPSDPVIDTAAGIQGAIAGLVDDLGPMPPLIALAALILGTVLFAVLHRARRSTVRKTASPRD